MYEERIQQISKILGGKKETYFVLVHKKHRREVYFQNQKEALEFIKLKFNSPVKRFFYNLIRINLVKPFLKKIDLNSNIGEVIFVANQIKGFNLKKKKVYSFTNLKRLEDHLIRSKEVQKEFAKKGFAPKISKLDKKNKFSEEELLPHYNGGDDLGIFKRVFELYKSYPSKKVGVSTYAKELRKKTKLLDGFLGKVFDKLEKSDKTITLVRAHGDFSEDQILIKDKKYVFIDWSPFNSNDLVPMASDLINMFDREISPLKNRRFNKILSRYSSETKDSIKEQILLYTIIEINKKQKMHPSIKKRLSELVG